MTIVDEVEKAAETEGASVTVNLHVEDVLGRRLKNEDERAKFLATISSFFSSLPVYAQLKEFVKINM